METETTIQPFKKIDWRWVGIGYCFFVVFHLLPSYLLLGLSRAGMGSMFFKGIWLFVGLAVIGVYIGYRSRGITVVEPGISSILYMITLTFTFNDFWGRSLDKRTFGLFLVWMAVAFATSFMSAWVGELLQLERGKRTDA